MKRTLFVALIMGLVSGLVQAAPVSESAARVIAAQFMAKKQLGNISTATPRMLRGKATNQPALYVFNTEKAGCGWVIVSGDDRTQQVLGYSDRDNYDPENVPENMQWWLSQYVEEIASLDDSDNSGLPVLGSLESDQHSAMPKAAPIAPLIQTKWNQNSPYNLQCPEINSNHCVTGCVATSMAQVMYYHQW
ncbi:MAG: Spi family protease inhibitor, partial [Muribaculaceae bacterium]|nr:Spi family protease inhibitor [Muribaculaceae bacterium]